ncbi:hypothetical protein NGR_b01430 (plasmid) [Sinorhizobium fredii NGR234]|uniref:Uncharacterized protein n=1 Tax=Sinorhizobium fredii (strain NBRC 101917 / NGR234) TaxID=394 RepID=C3KN36_SINFN|nr:hypothetical protein NGR_b01430 [Sinorhizobium fredii NGR234]
MEASAGGLNRGDPTADRDDNVYIADLWGAAWGIGGRPAQTEQLAGGSRSRFPLRLSAAPC